MNRAKYVLSYILCILKNKVGPNCTLNSSMHLIRIFFLPGINTSTLLIGMNSFQYFCEKSELVWIWTSKPKCSPRLKKPFSGFFFLGKKKCEQHQLSTVIWIYCGASRISVTRISSSSSAAEKYPDKDKPAVLCLVMAMSLTSLFMPMKLEPSPDSIL